MDENNRFSYKYLDENIVDFSIESKNDILGNNIYVDVLEELILKLSNNMNSETIALTGKWGSGKSSVIKSLENRMTKSRMINNLKVEFIYYNAWKYSNDDFRRSFLLDNTKDCGKDEIKSKLYGSESTTNFYLQDKVKIFAVSIILLLAFFFVLFFLGENQSNDFITRIKNSIPDALILVVLVSIYERITKTIFLEKQTTKTIILSPQDFSSMFINQMKDKDKYSIFVIDDLDRCTDIQIIEIMDTIHGFLRNNDNKVCNYIFLIPMVLFGK